jgi:hypothetical protein
MCGEELRRTHKAEDSEATSNEIWVAQLECAPMPVGLTGYLAQQPSDCTHPSRLKSNWSFLKAIKAINMKAMKFMTTLERDEDGVWVAEFPSIPRLCQSRQEP